MRSQEKLKKLQSVLLEILIEFDRVCSVLGLRYSLSSGTLLGAVRHGGFIPWDDDVDVVMPRKDYERFIKEAPALLDKEKYSVEHFSINSKLRHTFAKLMNIKTTFVELEMVGTKGNFGIWLDIFPVDRCPDDEHIHKKIARTHLTYWRFQWADSKAFRKCLFPKAKRIPAWCMGIITKIIGYEKLVRKEDEYDKKYLNDTTATATCADSLTKTKWMPYSWFEEYTTITFEGKEFSVITNYKGYLKRIYGDYMKLPPENERKTHLAKIIDCERPYTDYVDERGKLKQ